MKGTPTEASIAGYFLGASPPSHAITLQALTVDPGSCHLHCSWPFDFQTALTLAEVRSAQMPSQAVAGRPGRSALLSFQGKEEVAALVIPEYRPLTVTPQELESLAQKLLHLSIVVGVEFRD